MTFAEKLNKLTEEGGKSKLAIAARLPATAISDYINKGNIPRSDKALQIARALGVTLDWLVDDSQGWPPPDKGTGSSMTTEELTIELGRRLRPLGTEMLINIHLAWKTDWLKVAEKLLALELDAHVPPGLRRLAELPGELNLLANSLRHYDPRLTTGSDAPADLLKEVQPEFEAGILDLWQWKKNLNDRPGYTETQIVAGALLLPADFRPPWHMDNLARAKETATASLADLKARPPKPLMPLTQAYEESRRKRKQDDAK